MYKVIFRTSLNDLALPLQLSGHHLSDCQEGGGKKADDLGETYFCLFVSLFSFLGPALLSLVGLALFIPR